MMVRRQQRAFPIALFAGVALLLLLALPMQWSWADGGADGEGEQQATQEQAAIVSCLEGLFEGWEVPDAASFYASEGLDPSDGTGSWLAFDVYRAGLVGGSDAFVRQIERYVTEGYAGEERGIDSRSSTTWSRTIIVAGTLGADPSSIGEKPDGQPADLLSDGIFNWSYTQSLGEQGANAWIYALQAIDAVGATVPEGAVYDTATIVQNLLACQAADGSFALSAGSTTGSVDLTGMALAALGSHRDDPAIRQSIEAALAYLSENQDDDGGFSAEGESTSESCSMVIVGLSACGIDAGGDERFAKNGSTPVDALLSYVKPDGTFGHLKDDATSTQRVQYLPTEQALRALLALEELRQGGDGNVYTSDVAIDVPGVQRLAGAAASDSGLGMGSADWGKRLFSMAIGCVAALVLIGIVTVVRKKRGKKTSEWRMA